MLRDQNFEPETTDPIERHIRALTKHIEKLRITEQTLLGLQSRVTSTAAEDALEVAREEVLEQLHDSNRRLTELYDIQDGYAPVPTLYQ